MLLFLKLVDETQNLIPHELAMHPNSIKLMMLLLSELIYFAHINVRHPTVRILGHKFIKFLHWFSGKLKTPKSCAEIN